nr:MAG TPA: Recombination enhancement, RecA-dependent nuclease [Caudoviricetes sp.]
MGCSMKKLWSVFTDDMNHCYFTGTAPVERHHIWGGSNRKNSEKYGFVIPLRPDLHPNGAQAGKNVAEIDLKLKQMAQKYFEEHCGTREDFRRIFGKSVL